jgi:hypothetical protein
MLVFIRLFITTLSVSNIVLSQYMAIKGIQTGVNFFTGARPARQNILVLQNDVPALYVHMGYFLLCG